MMIDERLLFGAVFCKMAYSDVDGIVIRDCPEAFVEEPMGVLTKRYAVSDVVVAGVGELMNVRRVDYAP